MTQAREARAVLIAMRSTRLIVVMVAAVTSGCVTREIVYVQQAPTQMQVQASMQVQINCDEFCRPSFDACRVSCRPQAWSPNMRDIESSCEHDCDFNRFSCESRCRAGQGR